jgi:hypothetical protein
MKTAFTLSTLAAKINAHHQHCVEAAGQALEHAKHAGELLTLAKDKVTHGDWLPWLKANVPFSEKTAQNYMRVAREWTRLTGGKSATVADLTLRQALEVLAEPVTHAVVVQSPSPGGPPAPALRTVERVVDDGGGPFRFTSTPCPEPPPLPRIVPKPSEFEAIHEAAHAVIAHVLGIGVKGLSLTPDDPQNAGHCLVDRNGEPEHQVYGRRHVVDQKEEADLLWATNKMTMLAAGRLAAARQFGDPGYLRDGSQGDRDQAARCQALLRDARMSDGMVFLLTEETLAHLGRFCVAQAQNLLDHTPVWQAVKALAKELLARKSMTGAEVRALLKERRLAKWTKRIAK